ncbi:dipeptidyl aminopeptidase [Massilia sp. Root351]|jgi:dipeptidyl aminopeptidase/acylaminoacyl peptidase|uniref:S9 family peptidase n=1 Tax=Massilia sp. Root351 TaxID=1736522 RepID=UPI000708DF7D|nr:alpha/beta fold hydrolase [Massilia sp. Root351]KQV90768.1 dipeptidyl aminopeptidase [Massilia sp. Root351]
MQRLFQRTILAAALSLAALGAPFACAAAPSATAAALPPVEDFFSTPEFSSPTLSPSGRYLAARLGGKGQRDRLAVLDLKDNSAKVVAQFSNADISSITWVNDERIAFDSTDRTLAPGDEKSGPGLYAVNRDGSGYKQLVNRNIAYDHPSPAAKLVPSNVVLLQQRGPQDSEFVYVLSPQYSAGGIDYVDLLRLNTLTGKASQVSRPGPTRAWLLDFKGNARMALTLDRDQAAIHYLDPATEKWRQLTAFPAYAELNSFTPVGLGPDGTLYVSARAGQDKTSLYSYDIASGKLAAKPLVTVADYDFAGSLIMDKDKLLGVRYSADAVDTVWLDPAMKAMQARIDALMPHTTNLVTLPRRPETPMVLVTAYSDSQPSSYYLYDREKNKLDRVGSSYPKIDAGAMGKQAVVRYAARDGLQIPALLTLPPGRSKHLPLVVLVHGGPYSRGSSWGWNPHTQFLATRGYAVLEPDFRGSTGLGDAHFRAGWKQWGLKMQDDVADAAKWATAQGIADGKRICIAGASYGGYAALMGLVNDGDLYQCGINWVGVTDIALMYSAKGKWHIRPDLSDDWKQYAMPLLVGDQDKDAAQLKATSPLQQAARIQRPLLMAYGGADRRVTQEHGTQMRDALQAAGQAPEWVLYPDEGHGWKLTKTQIDFWTRVERFLDKNIGPAKGAQ